jgi:hypothetical protein
MLSIYSAHEDFWSLRLRHRLGDFEPMDNITYYTVILNFSYVLFKD